MCKTGPKKHKFTIEQLSDHITRIGQLGLGYRGRRELVPDLELRFFFGLSYWYATNYPLKVTVWKQSWSQWIASICSEMWEQEGWRLQTAHLTQLLLSQLGTQRDDSAASMLGTTPGKWGKMAFVVQGTRLISEIKLSFISLLFQTKI